MRLARLIPLLLLGIAGACDSATAPGPRTLLGHWTTSTPGSPRGTYQTRLTFGTNGRFEADFRAYGVYDREAASELSAFSRYVGSYAVRDDSLALRPDSMFVWDRFYGTASPTTVYTTNVGTIFDFARFDVRGDSLVIDYLSYPADAPVATRQTFLHDH
jgi:hypothetical protein